MATAYRAANDASAKWTQTEAIALCREVEAVCPAAGCHVALTGGTLYKDGERKDLDLLFYRIRQVPAIDMGMLWDALATIGIEIKRGFGWCFKAEYHGKSIDCFFPEEDGGDYESAPSEQTEPFCDEEIF
jgi:hypothetical protein